VKRRAAIVAATLALTAGLGTTSALAASSDATVLRRSGGETNGCIVITPLQLAICIPRF
jgi:hypothetical protein